MLEAKEKIFSEYIYIQLKRRNNRYKEKAMEILEIENTVIEMKNSVNELNNKKTRESMNQKIEQQQSPNLSKGEETL